MRTTRAALLVCLLPLIAGCTQLFYFPSREVFAPTPANAEDVAFRSSDGTLLHGWWLHATDGHPKATFVHFHGNAANMTGHVRQLAWVTRRGYDLFEFDYRGYGASRGVPSPEGLNRDAVAAIRYVRAEIVPQNHTPLVMYGQSLGGAVMLRALGDAGAEDTLAVVVESSFHSYQEVAASLLWRTQVLVPFTWLAYSVVSDEYAPDAIVPRISPVPLLVIHGDQDPIVDVRFGRVLYDIAREPKTLWIVKGGGHVDALRAFGETYRNRLIAFLEQAAARPPSLRRPANAP